MCRDCFVAGCLQMFDHKPQSFMALKYTVFSAIIALPKKVLKKQKDLKFWINLQPSKLSQLDL